MEAEEERQTMNQNQNQNSNLSPGVLLTLDEACAILRVSRWHLYTMVRGGIVPAVRVGRRAWRVRKDDLEKIVREGIRWEEE